MADFLTFAALVILLAAVIGLLRILRGPSPADRLMAAQLLGSAAVGITLLLAFAGHGRSLIDIALTLALLAAFASVAFSLTALGSSRGEDET